MAGLLGGGMLVSGSSISKDSGIIVFVTQLVTRESSLPATQPRLEETQHTACMLVMAHPD